MDLLSPLFSRFSLSARVFYSGALCGAEDFDPRPGLGYLHVLRHGHLRVTQPGAPALDIAQPSLLFYPRPCLHRFQIDDPDGAELVCALIDFGLALGNPLLRGLPDLLYIPLASIDSIEPTLSLLFEEGFGERPGRQAAIDRLAEYVLMLLLRHAINAHLIDGGVVAALADRRLAKAVTAMHEQPEHPWSLDELARIAGMSRARFAVNFRETVGTTPLDYLTDWRISVAQTLFKRGQALKWVAPRVGYSNPAALARVFSRRMGVSLSEWRKRSQEGVQST